MSVLIPVTTLLITNEPEIVSATGWQSVVTRSAPPARPAVLPDTQERGKSQYGGRNTRCGLRQTPAATHSSPNQPRTGVPTVKGRVGNVERAKAVDRATLVGRVTGRRHVVDGSGGP